MRQHRRPGRNQNFLAHNTVRVFEFGQRHGLPQCRHFSGKLSDVWSRGVVVGVGLDIHGDLQHVGIGIWRAHQLHADG